MRYEEFLESILEKQKENERKSKRKCPCDYGICDECENIGKDNGKFKHKNN